MAHITASDGVELYYEEAGQGTPVLFVHEFMGDCRSWAAQLQHFSRHHRCIAYNARGYPPAHIVGLSMGASAAFYFTMRWPQRVLSLTVAGIGSGSMPDARARFRQETEAAATKLLTQGWERNAEAFGASPTRMQLQNKNPGVFAEFIAMVSQHSAEGSALTLRGYQALRPSLGDFKEEMAKCTVPTLIITGDEDEPCLDTSLMLKRDMPSSGLVVMPQTGHTCNLEEPEMFNTMCGKFFDLVESGDFRMLDPRATPGRML
jgi:pimeloyl-ACP methyl ester carboxylesterase